MWAEAIAVIAVAYIITPAATAVGSALVDAEIMPPGIYLARGASCIAMGFVAVLVAFINTGFVIGLLTTVDNP